MSASPRPPADLASADRCATQIGVVRELALCGRSTAARRLCASLFLHRLHTLAHEPGLLQRFVECLLLLEMVAMLPRVLRAVYGVEADLLPLGDPVARRWRLSVNRCVVLLVPAPGLQAVRAEREEMASLWSRRILATAAEEPYAPADARIRTRDEVHA